MQLKKPSYEQRKLLNAKSLDPHEWHVKKILKEGILVRNITTGEEKVVAFK